MAFGRLGRGAAPRPISEINVTPLVDVMLVLVVIFILAAPLLAGSIRLQLPKAQGAQAQVAEPLALEVDAQGGAHWQGEALADAALAARLAQIASQAPQAEIALRADARVPYGRVLQLIGVAQAAGLSRIAFVAEPGAQRP